MRLASFAGQPVLFTTTGTCCFFFSSLSPNPIKTGWKHILLDVPPSRIIKVASSVLHGSRALITLVTGWNGMYRKSVWHRRVYKCIYLVWWKFPFICNSPPQAGHRAKQRHGQANPQEPLPLGAEHQNHTQRPATRKWHNDGRQEIEELLFSFTADFSLWPGKVQKKTFMNKSIHFNINNGSLECSLMWAK